MKVHPRLDKQPLIGRSERRRLITPGHLGFERRYPCFLTTSALRFSRIPRNMGTSSQHARIFVSPRPPTLQPGSRGMSYSFLHRYKWPLQLRLFNDVPGAPLWRVISRHRFGVAASYRQRPISDRGIHALSFATSFPAKGRSVPRAAHIICLPSCSCLPHADVRRTITGKQTSASIVIYPRVFYALLNIASS